MPRVAVEKPAAADPLFSSLTGLQCGRVSSRKGSGRAWVQDDLVGGKLQRERGLEGAWRPLQGGLWLAQQWAPQFHGNVPYLPKLIGMTVIWLHSCAHLLSM